jgi:DNA processing protein
VRRDELYARLALRSLPRLKDEERVELLRRYGSARAVLRTADGAVGRQRAAELRSARLTERVEAAMRVVTRLDLQVLSPGDAAFPPLPEPLPPPPVLFARGDLAVLRLPCAAVVGTRRCTEYGEDIAEELAAALARAGVTVISGMARGIDSVAHRAALAGGGATVAVLGCGMDVVYPRENVGLQEDIGEAGLLLSEFLPGEPPRPHHFLQRNRLIAGYSKAVVVVEGGATSGAINTAHHALAADIPVFGVPGLLGRGTSDGPLRLLRDGALIYTEPLDVLLELGRVGHVAGRAGAEAPVDDASASAPTGLPPQLEQLVRLGVRRESRHVDAISLAAGAPVAEALAGLFELEVAGMVEQLPGMRFRLARVRSAAAAETRAAPGSGSRRGNRPPPAG